MPRKPYKTWGIKHKRTALTPELLDSEEGKKFIQKTLTPPKIEEMLNNLESQAKRVLRGYNLDENWMAHIGTPPEALPEQAYHCIEILTRMDRVRHWINENNSCMAATETIHMMNAVADSMLTFLEPDLYRGKKLLEKASLGGKQKNNANAMRRSFWQREAKEIWKANPTYSVRVVAQAIAQKTGEKFETIRHYIKKPK